MRDRVISALKIYAEGGSLAAALRQVHLAKGDFYKMKRENPDLQTLYLQTQESRADMMVDESYEISETVLTDESADPRRARVASDIRMNIAKAFDRDRFGDNVKLNINASIDLSGALLEAKQRAAQPGRNLGQVTDAEYEVLPHVQRIELPDLQSDSAPVPAGFVDPFSDD